MNKQKRLSPNHLAREKAYFTNLKNIVDYQSLNPEFNVAAIQTVVEALDAALEREALLLAELAEVRDLIAENGTLLTQKNDGAVIQVAAQFGEDSPEYQALGRTRKSDRASGLHRGPKGSQNPPPG